MQLPRQRCHILTLLTSPTLTFSWADAINSKTTQESEAAHQQAEHAAVGKGRAEVHNVHIVQAAHRLHRGESKPVKICC